LAQDGSSHDLSLERATGSYGTMASGTRRLRHVTEVGVHLNREISAATSVG